MVVILVNFFPVTIDLFDGLQAVNREQAELMDTFGAGVLYKFIHLKMPSALPYFFSSLNVVVPWAVIGATIAEWLLAPAGHGICKKTAWPNWTPRRCWLRWWFSPWLRSF